MYRSYLLKNNFWAKKGNEKDPNAEKVYIRHDINGGTYAIIQKRPERGVKVITNGEEHFFNNFDRLDHFLNNMRQADDFSKILRRKTISQKLRRLDI